MRCRLHTDSTLLHEVRCLWSRRDTSLGALEAEFQLRQRVRVHTGFAGYAALASSRYDSLQFLAVKATLLEQ